MNPIMQRMMFGNTLPSGHIFLVRPPGLIDSDGLSTFLVDQDSGNNALVKGWCSEFNGTDMYAEPAAPLSLSGPFKIEFDLRVVDFSLDDTQYILQSSTVNCYIILTGSINRIFLSLSDGVTTNTKSFTPSTSLLEIGAITIERDVNNLITISDTHGSSVSFTSTLAWGIDLLTSSAGTRLFKGVIPSIKIFNSVGVLINHWVGDAGRNDTVNNMYDVVGGNHATISTASTGIYTAAINSPYMAINGGYVDDGGSPNGRRTIPLPSEIASKFTGFLDAPDGVFTLTFPEDAGLISALPAAFDGEGNAVAVDPYNIVNTSKVRKGDSGIVIYPTPQSDSNLRRIDRYIDSSIFALSDIKASLSVGAMDASYSGAEHDIVDYLGNTISSPVNVAGIAGGRYSSGVWYYALADGTTLQPYIDLGYGNKWYLFYPARLNATTYELGGRVRGVAVDGTERWYECTTAGVSDISPPTFPVSGTVAEGTAIWTYGGYHTIKGYSCRLANQTVLDIPGNGVIRANDIAIMGRVVPRGGLQGKTYFWSSEIDDGNLTGVYHPEWTTAEIFRQRKKIDNVNFYNSTEFTPLDGVMFEYQAYFSATDGAGLAYRVDGGEWSEWVCNNCELGRASLPIGSTYQIGSRAGVEQFSADFLGPLIIQHNNPRKYLEWLRRYFD